MRIIKDNISLGISFLALIMSALAIYIPYHQQENRLKEKLIIEINQYPDADIILPQMDASAKMILIPVQLVISNVGHEKLSIINHHIQTGNEKKFLVYGALYRDFINKDGRKENFPIMLEGGESKTFTTYAGMQISQEAFDILESESKERRINSTKARVFLGRNGYDYLGNRIEFEEIGRTNDYRYASFAYNIIKKVQEYPSVFLELTTGRKNTFTAVRKLHF